MAVIRKEISINVPPDAVFDLITDPEKIRPFIPGVMRVWNVPRLPLSANAVFDWEYQFLGLPFRGHWVVEDYNRPMKYSATTTGGIGSHWLYGLAPEAQRTKLSLEISFDPPTTLIRRYALSLIEPHTDQLAETYLQSLKLFLETPPAQKEIA